jgi:hypothetical protein
MYYNDGHLRKLVKDSLYESTIGFHSYDTWERIKKIEPDEWNSFISSDEIINDLKTRLGYELSYEGLRQLIDKEEKARRDWSKGGGSGTGGGPSEGPGGGSGERLPYKD